MARATVGLPYSSNNVLERSARHTRRKTTLMATASATHRASRYKTSSKAVVAAAEPNALEVSTHNDDYAHSHAPREKMVPVDDGLTDRMQRRVSQSAR